MAVSLASDVNVKFRKVILEKFKDKQLTLLLATDLLARGIDIDSLECVVNFDVPRDIETYTHRAGRTGRMGKEGYVITLITHPEDLKKLKKLLKCTRNYLEKPRTLYQIIPIALCTSSVWSFFVYNSSILAQYQKKRNLA